MGRLAPTRIRPQMPRGRTGLLARLLVAMLAAASLSAPPLGAQQSCIATPDIEGALLAGATAARHTEKARHFAERGNPRCAAIAYRNAIGIDPEAWAPRYGLGSLNLAEGRHGEALEHLEVASRLRHDHLDTLIALASALHGLGQLDRAGRELANAVRDNPRSATARRLLARTLADQGRHVAAIGHLERALELEPDSPESLLLLGLVHSQSGHPERAVGPLQRLVRSSPEHFAGRFNLAAAYAQQELYPEASEQYAKALQIDPSNPEARLAAARVEINLRNFRVALALTDPLVDVQESPSGNFELLHIRGIALRDIGALDEAETALRDAVAANGASAQVRRALGELLVRQGRGTEARVHLQRARDLEPDSQAARFALISVLRTLGETSALAAEIEDFENRKREILGAEMAERLAERAASHLEDGNAATALGEYEQALRHDQRNPGLHYGRALALARLDRQQERIAALEAALALDPSHAPSHAELGLSLAGIGRIAEAEAAFRTAIAADPQGTAAKGNFGVLLMTLGRHADAERMFRQAVEDAPDVSHLRVNHGLALAALGRFADAERAVREAARINPAEPKVDGALAAIAELRRTAAEGASHTP